MSQPDLEKDILSTIDKHILRARQMVVGRDTLFLIARALFENKHNDFAARDGRTGSRTFAGGGFCGGKKSFSRHFHQRLAGCAEITTRPTIQWT
jgi:hypothetical protein